MQEEFICSGSKNASHRLVLLHGWGADADDLIPFGRQLSIGLDISFELISLRAPYIHPQGIGRQWYGLNPPDWSQASLAVKELELRLNKIGSSSIGLRKTILLGFSQGGAMALATGMYLPLAGLVVCSGYPHPGCEPQNQSPPIFLMHGQNDPVVPLEASESIFNVFKSKNLEVELEIFEGGHEISMQMINKIQSTIKKWLN